MISMAECCTFYRRAQEYWSSIEATQDGVLGGFGFISEVDLKGSETFLQPLLKNNELNKLALDCGAGIGRITRGLLVKYFDKVDLVEQNPKFLDVAATTVEPKEKVGDLYPVGLQNFIPDKKYDLIWCQWVLGHLTNDDLVRFLILCKKSLSKNGFIVVKENVTSSGKIEKDKVDSSVTRPLKSLLVIFKKAGLSILKEHKQTDFPPGIYPVHIFALQPATKPKEQNKSPNLSSELNKLNISTNNKNLVINESGKNKVSNEEGERL